VLDALPTPVFFKDRSGRYQGCNRAFTELMGKQPGELIGLTVYDLSPPDLARIYEEADEALMRSGGEQRYETQVQRPDGQRRHVLFYKAAVRDEHGEVCGLVGTILDITERKDLERRLSDLADLDALTGLFNRRAILSHLEGLHADRRQQRLPLCLLMVDVDHFKSINDRFGHAIGDEALVRVASCLRQNLRDAIAWAASAAKSSWWCWAARARRCAGRGRAPAPGGRADLRRHAGRPVAADGQHRSGAQPARRGLGPGAGPGR